MTDPSIILDIEPDWGVEPEVSYSFTTVVQDTPYFVEQRRPLLASPVRSANYKFTESNEQFQRLCNTLVEAKDQQICVPLFNEPIFASSIVTGGSSITATTDLTYLWNIHNCSYVVLLNFVTGESEMIGVTSVSGQLIRLATNIVGVWIAAQTVIFPAMAAELVSMKQSFATDSIGSIEAEFSESVLGTEATGEWVDLDEQTCCEDSWVTPDLCSEYFNGTNGSAPSEDVLSNYYSFYENDPTIQDNGLKFTFPSILYYRTTFEFLGEYDFYINYTFYDYSSVPEIEEVYIEMKNSSTWIGFYIPEDKETPYYYGGSGGSDVNSSVLTGKLRIRRDSSNNVYIYYWNESLSRWEWDGDTDGLLTDNYSGADYPLIQCRVGDESMSFTIWEFVTTTGCDNTQPVTP